MSLSLIALAEEIDRLVEARQAFVVETEGAVTVSALLAAHASELRVLCEALEWPVQLFDGAGAEWAPADAPDPALGPYRLAVQKPAAPRDTLQLLSNAGFAYWLENGHVAPRWHVARLTGSLVAGARAIEPWGGAQDPAPLPPTKSPRALVKEFGNIRRVPAEVRCWLPKCLEADHFGQPATQIWVRAASAALINCLPDELDADSGNLRFRGPPKLTLSGFASDFTNGLDRGTFNVLLDATRWVFENEREAEMRHILLAAELARSGASSDDTPGFLHYHLAHAWESAQIAYQMALAETSRETLKVLSDLRKAVTEETAKLSDISRQLTASVAAALATGIGLIAARVTTNAPAALIAIVMLVVALYIVMVIYSGVQFMRLQRQLRVDWQHRLYRFLPTTEYALMVETPTAKAERSFIWSAWLGGVAVAILSLACAWVVLVPTFPVPVPQGALTLPDTPPASSAQRADKDKSTPDGEKVEVKPVVSAPAKEAKAASPPTK